MKRGAFLEKKVEVGRKVEMLSRQIRRKVDESISSQDLTAKQAMILLVIYDLSKVKDVYAKDIEDTFDMRRATVTGILQLMEKNGIIVREENNVDGRLKRIRLTQKAINLRLKMKKNIQKVESNLLSDLSKEEIETFLKIMEKMSHNLCTKKEEESND